MKIEDKIELNKKIKSYDGNNTFLISLRKLLKTSKFLEKVEFNKKTYKLLSDKQYDVAVGCF